MSPKEEKTVLNWLSAIFLEVPNPQEMILPSGERVRIVMIRMPYFASFLCRIGVPVVPTIEECRALRWCEDMAKIESDGKETRLIGIRADVLKATARPESETPNATPPDPFTEPRRLAKDLGPVSRKLLETVCDRGGSVSLAELAKVLEWDPNSKDQSFDKRKAYINKRIKRINWTLDRKSNEARLERI